MHNILLILSSVSLNAFAQLFIRQGMLKMGNISMNMNSLWHMMVQAISNVYIWAGMLSYAISIFLWMIVLSKVNVSLAYPFLSIGYILTAIIAYFVFGEPITWQKAAGILIICFGVVVLTYSKDFVQ
jgi:multidrug transporter EmrE-like cation transporter